LFRQIVHRLLKTESGYTLVEVMVSIMILAIAILPMAGMFDMGLYSATKGSNYDKARTLANLKMEEAKSLPFATVKNSFPTPNGSAPSTTTGSTQATCGDLSVCDPAIANAFPEDFEYTVQKQVMRHDAAPTSSSIDFKPCNSAGLPNTCSTTPTGPIRITVIVQWGNGNTYTTFGLVT
jgi:prepilin-type N-terminal cleavage/methylation domain-containing protein